jgi:glycosyltransferase involved in cell wall biosynthesis
MAARVCLNMIVKNEASVIERCLRSVRPYIHAWAIADTGSTDGTQDIVRKFLADLPGELIERPWVDFATNRNEALDVARRHGDYALIIDADDTLEADADFVYPALEAPGYVLKILYGQVVYWRDAFPRLDQDWKWEGVLHETLQCSNLGRVRKLDGLRIRCTADGARSKVGKDEKFARDAEVLRAALEKEPNNARYAFYLAQSLRDCGRLSEAIDAYRHRVEMGGWAEEVYFSKFMIARLKERSGAAYADVVHAYLEAYDFRPQRAETPGELARYFRIHKRFTLARDFARIACATPLPRDNLQITISAYGWRPRNELAASLYQLGDLTECANVCRQMLDDRELPATERDRVQRNLDRALADLAAQSAARK